MIINGVEVFLCNAFANKDCRGHKSKGCYLYGGPCRLTINKEYQQKMKVVLDEGAYLPTRAHPSDAGLDLYSREEEFWLWPGHNHKFDTGVHIELPAGTCGLIFSRSGLMTNYDIVAAGNGVIDERYTGSIGVKIYNMGSKGYHFIKGERIAQLVITEAIKPELEVVDALDQTDRGDAGFGSTGR